MTTEDGVAPTLLIVNVAPLSCLVATIVVSAEIVEAGGTAIEGEDVAVVVDSGAV
jgi:hypothetical protein